MEVECEDCGQAWQDVFAFAAVANFDFSESFALRKEPTVFVEEGSYHEDDQENRLMTFLIPAKHQEGELLSFMLTVSNFTVDIMEEDEFDKFIKDAGRLAERLNAKMDIQVNKEDYFDG